MKKMTRILLVNWLYYSQELVELGDVNFFTGKNGAGKSAFIDALQVVLLGELSSYNFNKAANERSTRTLDGYLRADRDNSSPKNRKGKEFHSYIVCEFFDDVSTKYFSIGVIFECYGDGSRKERFFVYDGEIPEHSFVLDGRTMDMEELKEFFKAHPQYRGELMDTHKRYRQSILAKWNIHTEQLFSMMKKGVSFKNVSNIQSFITENICDMPDELDIHGMQENIRHYKAQEKLALRQMEKAEALQQICLKYSDLEKTKEKSKLQDFLVVWGKKELLQGELKDLEEENSCLQEEIAILEEKQKEHLQCRLEKEEQCEQLKYKRDHDDSVSEKKRLEEEKIKLLAELASLNQLLQGSFAELQGESQEILKLCGEIQSQSLLFPELQKASQDLALTYEEYLHCELGCFGNDLEVFQSSLEKTTAFQELLGEISHGARQKLGDYGQQIGDCQQAISNLERNIKQYPKHLLALKTRLEESLSKENAPCSIVILADVLEIAQGQEGWRAVVEGYLHTQKFYLLLPEEHYAQGLSLFHQWQSLYGTGKLGLVDMKKLREKSKLTISPHSLAEKVETEHPLARDYIAYLLGRVICCEEVQELRGHPVAVTQSGMLYKNFVARPMNPSVMQDFFIGQRAVALQLEQMRLQLQSLQQEEQTLEESYAPIAHSRQWLFTGRYLSHELPQRQGQYLRSLSIAPELEVVEEGISACNLFWLEELKEKINVLTKEISEHQVQSQELFRLQVMTEGTLKRNHNEKIPKATGDLSQVLWELQEKFSPDYQEEVGIPRYLEVIKRLVEVEKLISNYITNLAQSRNLVQKLQEELRLQRVEYSHRFQPCSFLIDNESNEEYAQELTKLEESELPAYRSKIEEAKNSAMEQFQYQFLDKLKSGIDQVTRQVDLLNKALKDAQFGNDKYQFKVKKHPDYSDYYEMIMAEERLEGDFGLFALEFDQKYGALRDDLFYMLSSSEDDLGNPRKQSELEQNVKKYTDFRTYLHFDMETTDQNGDKQLLSKVLSSNSGGETQTPFYVAILASFAQLYKVNDLSTKGNTLRLVVFDEAFSKMDSERIIESVRLLRTLNLQAIICTPPEKIQDIAPEADRTILFIKDGYTMKTAICGKVQSL